MGSSRPRNSTRARKARSVKRSPSSPRAADRLPTKPRMPAAIDIAVDDQRESLGIAISILYCLHSTLGLEAIPNAGPSETGAVEDAAKWADLTDITAMLLVRLSSIHLALDSTELVNAKVDEGRVELTEMARELVGRHEVA